MAKGIAAFVFLVSLIFSITILSGLGFYAQLGVSADVETHNEDVQNAAENLEGIEYDEDRSPPILQGPLAAVIPVVEILQTFTTVLGNTSGVLQLLFGAPEVVADTVELFFRITMLVTIAFLIRGAVQ